MVVISAYEKKITEQNLKNLELQRAHENVKLSSNVTKEELLLTTKRMKRWKSPETDGLPIEWYRTDVRSANPNTSENVQLEGGNHCWEVKTLLVS